MRFLILFASLISVAGCVPLATPPLRVRAAAGPGFGTDANGRSVNRVLIQGTAAIHPLQLVPDASRGPLDLGLGYQVQGTAEAQPSPATRDRVSSPVEPSIEAAGLEFHGPELEVGWYPLRPSLGGSQMRVGGFAATEVLLTDRAESRLGYGATAGVAVEITGYGFSPVVSRNEDVTYAGIVGGQWGIGVYAAGNVREIGDGRYFTLSFGVSGRIPFTAGVACCVWPGKKQRR